uniref:Glycine C-acetyltransferase n=1 Tax=Oncorhynchus tshawytscha TaxID=74940 RepID=A0A8C8GR54_ONCTS
MTGQGRNLVGPGRAKVRLGARPNDYLAIVLVDLLAFKGPEYFQMHSIRWIWVFCFLSAGYTVGPKPLIDLLRQRRPYLFSNSLPPPVVGCATRAVDVGDNTMRFRNKMTEAEFTISGSDHPISSLMADDMLKLGVYVIGFSYPVVPKGKARIRVQISAAHTDQDIDSAVDAFIQTGRKHGVLP